MVDYANYVVYLSLSKIFAVKDIHKYLRIIYILLVLAMLLIIIGREHRTNFSIKITIF